MNPRMDQPPSSLRIIDAETAAALIDPLTELVARAGAAILAVNRKAMGVADKGDGSPVTDADLAADRLIAEGLARLAPDLPVLSEERAHATKPPYRGSFFLVDPLDGTKEFIAGRSEFTVNLALIVAGTPLVGIIGAPALGVVWRGLVGRGAERLQVEQESGKTGAVDIGAAEPIHTRAMPPPGTPWVAAVSRSHADARSESFIKSRPNAVRLQLGSAVKFGRLAEGTVDIYPRLAPTSEWDVAAGHALVTAAGGKVTDLNGGALRFGQQEDGFVVPGFLAWGDPAAAQVVRF
jgi:3'(2'), 5'-bisphosphate nucleotidase